MNEKLILDINNISRVRSGNVGDILYGLDERDIAFLKREKEKRELQKLKGLLIITGNAINISQSIRTQVNGRGNGKIKLMK